MPDFENSVEIGKGVGLSEVEIVCPGITLEDAMPFLEINVVNSEIEEILKAIKVNNEPKIIDLLNSFHPKTFEEVIWFYKTTCALFLLKDGLTDPVQKIHLLERAFRVNIGSYNENPSPTYLHIVCKSLWDITKCNQNVIQLCKKLCTVNSIGFNVSICLIWAAIFNFFKHPIKVFRFHNFHELVEVLVSKDKSTLEQNLNETYILLQLVSFLQNIILVKNPNVPIQFKIYFSYTKEDLELFKNWCLAIRQMFDINFSNEVDLGSGYILIYELIELDILYRLENLL